MQHRQQTKTTSAQPELAPEELRAEMQRLVESMQTLLQVTCEEIERARVCMDCAWDPERCPERRASGDCEKQQPDGSRSSGADN